MLLFLTWLSLSHIYCSWWWSSKSIDTSFGLLCSENSMLYSGSMIVFSFSMSCIATSNRGHHSHYSVLCGAGFLERVSGFSRISYLMTILYAT